ncbi:hypothetical protein CFC21_064545 [Triticum aestivum]|uniref:Uncharacterized protein n=3 Tax=Triticum TaxID=4564 RepID=A0A9R0WKC1_TRITD|nr:hypothetical protein CFC21_064545 [Triticum aestivum]VAI13830.1 unnamed protein product [Triticum turgidum subsp. durum]
MARLPHASPIPHAAKLYKTLPTPYSNPSSIPLALSLTIFDLDAPDYPTAMVVVLATTTAVPTGLELVRQLHHGRLRLLLYRIKAGEHHPRRSCLLPPPWPSDTVVQSASSRQPPASPSSPSASQ